MDAVANDASHDLLHLAPVDFFVDSNPQTLELVAVFLEQLAVLLEVLAVSLEQPSVFLELLAVFLQLSSVFEGGCFQKGDFHVDPIESLIDLFESTIDLLEPAIDRVEPRHHVLAKALEGLATDMELSAKLLDDDRKLVSARSLASAHTHSRGRRLLLASSHGVSLRGPGGWQQASGRCKGDRLHGACVWVT